MAENEVREEGEITQSDVERYNGLRRLALNVILDCARVLASSATTEEQRAQELRWLDNESGVKFSFSLAADLVGTCIETGETYEDTEPRLRQELKTDPRGFLRRLEQSTFATLRHRNSDGDDGVAGRFVVHAPASPRLSA